VFGTQVIDAPQLPKALDLAGEIVTGLPAPAQLEQTVDHVKRVRELHLENDAGTSRGHSVIIDLSERLSR
jgi:hypothetical protein